MLQGYNPRWKAGHGRYNQIEHLNFFRPLGFEELCYAEPGTRFDNQNLQR